MSCILKTLSWVILSLHILGTRYHGKLVRIFRTEALEYLPRPCEKRHTREYELAMPWSRFHAINFDVVDYNEKNGSIINGTGDKYSDL